MTENLNTELKIESGLSKIIFKNTAFVTVGEMALKALGFLFSVYVIRQLGDSSFGQYSIVLRFVGLFQVFLELGMTQYVMRGIAQDKTQSQRLLWNLVSIRLILAVFGIIILAPLGVAFGYSTEIVLGIFLYTFTFVFSAFLMPLSAVLEANERYDYLTVITILGRFIFFLIGAIALFQGRSYIALILASLIVMPVQIIVSVALVGRHDLAKLKPSIQLSTWPALLRGGLPFGVISLFLTIAFGIDTVMLSWFEEDNVVGWYNVAYGLIPSISLFFGGFKRVIVPSLARTYVSDPVQVNRWYYGSVKFILLSSIPIAVGGMIVAFPLIDFLYGQEFLPAALALQILIWDVPFLMFASFGGNMTTIVGKENSAAKIYGINTIANVVLNLYAIPRFGLIGAAFVTVITDMIGALQFYFLLKRKMELPPIASMIIRIVIASALMGGILLLARDLNLFILIGLGALVYFGLILAFRLITHEELAVFQRSVRRIASLIRPKSASDERIGF